MLKKLLLSLIALIAGMVALAAVLVAWPLPDIPRDGVAGDFVVRNVAIVDVEYGVLREGQDVVLRGGRIAAIVPSGTESAEPAPDVVDGSGQYLLPGLWDMHTHSTKLSPQYQHPLQIANGVTGVRDLWGCMSEPDSFFGCIDDRQRWNEALTDGSGLSPRYFGQSSFQVNGGSEVPAGFPAFFKARTAEEAVQLARFYADAGADILKIYSDISPAAYTALAQAAGPLGLHIDGHRPIRVSLLDALAAGQRSIEHPRLFLFECFAEAAEFRALADPIAAYTPKLRARLVDEHDAAGCQAQIAAMADSGTWWTPTLQVLRIGALARDRSFREDPRLDYVPWLYRSLIWMPDADRKAATALDESGRDVYAAMYALALRHVGLAHAAGVKILAGTDTFDAYVFPGFSVHDELAEFVAAGLSPADALRAATIDAAVFSGAEASFGSIAVGKQADLLLLDANPLTDIRHTQRINGLFFNGRYFDRAALDRLLDFARQRAGSLAHNLRITWDAINSPLLRVQFAD